MNRSPLHWLTSDISQWDPDICHKISWKTSQASRLYSLVTEVVSKANQLATPFNSQPFRVVKVTGSRVTAVADGRYITRHITFFKPLRYEEHIHSSYYDLSPASKDVNTTPLSPAHLSEQTSVIHPDESAETSPKGTVTDAMQDTEKEQDLTIISI